MKAWQRILLGYGLLAVALGLLTALVGLMVTGLRLDQPRDVLVVVVVFNLMLAALFGGIALLDSRRWPSWPSRRIAGASIQPMPTLAGWLVLGATANCIAGISVFFGGDGASIWRSPAFMGVCIGVPFFLLSALVLGMCGVPVWRQQSGRRPPRDP